MDENNDKNSEGFLIDFEKEKDTVKKEKEVNKNNERIVVNLSDEDSSEIVRPARELEKIDYPWIEYKIDGTEICYLKDLMTKTKSQNIDFANLDLDELDDINIINVPKKFNEVAQDQFKRILRFGELDQRKKVAKKTGAFDKDKYNDKHNDYYDQNDPWIDDGEFEANNGDLGKAKANMAIPEVLLEDFYGFEGSLEEFKLSEFYKARVRINQMFEKGIEEEETKMDILRKEREKLKRKNKAQKEANKANSSNNNNVIGLEEEFEPKPVSGQKKNEKKRAVENKTDGNSASKAQKSKAKRNNNILTKSDIQELSGNFAKNQNPAAFQHIGLGSQPMGSQGLGQLQMNPIIMPMFPGNMNSLNAMNQMNQMNSINQMNQMNHQMNSMNQLNPMNQMPEMFSFNGMYPTQMYLNMMPMMDPMNKPEGKDIQELPLKPNFSKNDAKANKTVKKSSKRPPKDFVLENSPKDKSSAKTANEKRRHDDTIEIITDSSDGVTGSSAKKRKNVDIFESMDIGQKAVSVILDKDRAMVID